MSKSAQSGTSKRIRLVDSSAEAPNSVITPGSLPSDPGGGTGSPLAYQPGSVDTKSLLLEIAETEAGAANLADVLKDRRVRDILKQHGVNIQAADDVGYNSLPLELRDLIRKHLIAIVRLENDEEDSIWAKKCRRCPSLAPYACIDSEWRDAIERVTFQRLNFRRQSFLTKDEWLAREFDLLERFVVGSRRQNLQYICLPVDSLGVMVGLDLGFDEAPAEKVVQTFISPIRRLFNCVKKWHECVTGDGNLHIEILTTTLRAFGQERFPASRELLHAGLTDLPVTPQITHFSTALWESLDATSILILLSRTPNLRSVSIDIHEPQDLEDDEEFDSQTQLLFNSLSQTLPCLEALELKCCDGLNWTGHQMIFCTAALSYSQSLRKFSLKEISLTKLRSVLDPFSTPNFDSDAPPPRLWPNLTEFRVEKSHAAGVGDEIYSEINNLLLMVGRAIRFMPRIQKLKMDQGYYLDRRQYSSLRGIYCQANFELEVEPLRDSSGSLARLFVSHCRDPGLPENVPSEEVVELWKESLSHAASASLEVQIYFLTREGVWMLNGARIED